MVNVAVLMCALTLIMSVSLSRSDRGCLQAELQPKWIISIVSAASIFRLSVLTIDLPRPLQIKHLVYMSLVC